MRRGNQYYSFFIVRLNQQQVIHVSAKMSKHSEKQALLRVSTHCGIRI